MDSRLNKMRRKSQVRKVAHELKDGLRFDPTDPSILRTLSRVEIPTTDHCHYVSGTRHPTWEGIRELTMEAGAGSMVLPATVPLVNQNPLDRLSREAIYAQDLVWQTEKRAMHTMVIGPTGAGKNTTVIDPLRYSAIQDPQQTVVSFSLKSSDYGPVRRLCSRFKKRLYVINLNDASRSNAWNPLDVEHVDEAIDVIRRFADSVRNPCSNESEFWTQWIKTGMTGGWEAGYRSFPALYQLFTLPMDKLIATLRTHNNPSSTQLAGFLEGRSSNAETVLASIVAAMSSFLTESVMRIMCGSEWKLQELFRKPICLHVELPESRLETLLVLYQMFARALTDELINLAELRPRKVIPATLFYDDLPSLGRILTPARMMTMRSRGIGTVCGVQSLASLECIYGGASAALIDNVHTKIILPGGVSNDAEFFSQATGMQMVALPCYENQAPVFTNRPLLSGADIRTPSYHHPLLGMPATFIVGATTFQAYLQRTYEHPELASILREARGISGRERLRRKPLPTPPPLTQLSECSFDQIPPSRGITNTKYWTSDQLAELLEKVKKYSLGWDRTEEKARRWWLEFEQLNRTKLQVVVRLAEELQERKVTIDELFESYQESKSTDIRANLHYLEYRRIMKSERKESEQRKPDPNEEDSAENDREPF